MRPCACRRSIRAAPPLVAVRPVFRGLVSDGRGGFLCQVFWFRDQEMQVGDVYPREDGAPWPVEYLCHTVRLLPDGPYWTVEKLAETEGLLEDGFYYTQLPLCGPVTWSGEADSLRLEVSAAQILETGDGFLGRGRLRTPHDPSSFPFTIGETEEDDALSPRPYATSPPAFPPYTVGWWSPGRTPAASSTPTRWTLPHAGTIRTLWIFTRPMIMQTHRNSLRPPWKTAPPSTSGMTFMPWRLANRSRSMRGGGGGSGWRDCWTGICASTPPRTALPPV